MIETLINKANLNKQDKWNQDLIVETKYYQDKSFIFTIEKLQNYKKSSYKVLNQENHSNMLKLKKNSAIDY